MDASIDLVFMWLFILQESKKKLGPVHDDSPEADINAPKPVARPVNLCTTKDGRTFAVGDVVWGKVWLERIV